LNVIAYTDVKTGEEKEECNVMTWEKTKNSRHETLLKTGIITVGSQVCHQTKQHLSYTQYYKQSISISQVCHQTKQCLSYTQDYKQSISISQVCHQTKQHLSYTQYYKQSISISRAAVSFIMPYPGGGEEGVGSQ
jgi:hypothetical protein